MSRNTNTRVRNQQRKVNNLSQFVRDKKKWNGMTKKHRFINNKNINFKIIIKKS